MKEFFVSRCCRRYHSLCQICRWEGSGLVPPGSLQRLNLEWKKTKQSIKNKLHSNISPKCSLKLIKVPSFITFDSWSCSNRGPISSPTIPLMMASTSTRALLRRKLKSPNQKIWSNLVVTSAAIRHVQQVLIKSHTNLNITSPATTKWPEKYKKRLKVKCCYNVIFKSLQGLEWKGLASGSPFGRFSASTILL